MRCGIFFKFKARRRSESGFTTEEQRRSWEKDRIPVSIRSAAEFPIFHYLNDLYHELDSELNTLKYLYLPDTGNFEIR